MKRGRLILTVILGLMILATAIADLGSCERVARSASCRTGEQLHHDQDGTVNASDEARVADPDDYRA
jgi:hypothetical protein